MQQKPPPVFPSGFQDADKIGKEQRRADREERDDRHAEPRQHVERHCGEGVQEDEQVQQELAGMLFQAGDAEEEPRQRQHDEQSSRDDAEDAEK